MRRRARRTLTVGLKALMRVAKPLYPMLRRLGVTSLLRKMATSRGAMPAYYREMQKLSPSASEIAEKIEAAIVEGSQSTEVSTWNSGGYQAKVRPGEYQIDVHFGDRQLGSGLASLDVHTSLDQPAKAISKVVEQRPYDLVIMGALGVGAVKDSVIGSNTERVVRRIRNSDKLIIKNKDAEEVTLEKKGDKWEITAPVSAVARGAVLRIQQFGTTRPWIPEQGRDVRCR